MHGLRQTFPLPLTIVACNGAILVQSAFCSFDEQPGPPTDPDTKSFPCALWHGASIPDDLGTFRRWQLDLHVDYKQPFCMHMLASCLPSSGQPD